MTNTDIVLSGTRRRGMGKLMLALLAGSIAAGAGSFAYARTDGASADPAKLQQRIEKRVDRAFKGTDVTDAQKAKVTEIMKASFADLKPVREKAMANHKAMKEAMQAPTIDKAKIEQIRVEQIKLADESSKQFTKALTDAGDQLSQPQRQAFFKAWGERRHGKRHG